MNTPLDLCVIEDDLLVAVAGQNQIWRLDLTRGRVSILAGSGALGLVGTPYRYGGNTPDTGFDCSGLVNYVYRDMLDLRLPRSSGELAALQGPRLAPDRLASGDLVFFGSRGTVTHVGIYVGEGRFVHAPSSGGTVRLDRLDGPYWRDHYSGAKRVLR